MAGVEARATAPVSFPPDPNPRKPKLALPPGSWDTHFHVIGPPHVFPLAEKRWHTPPAAPIEHYLLIAQVLGIERGCTVQSSAHGGDPAVTLDAIRKSDGRLCGIIRADPNLEDVDVRKLHAGGVRGMRIELRQRGSAAAVQGMTVDPRAQDGAYEGQRFERVVALAARANWIIALHIDAETLIAKADMIARMPVRTIIENFAAIDARKGLDQAALRTLAHLASEKHVWLKLAAADRMMLRGATYEQIVPLVRAVHSASPDRSIWGTDWPHPGIFRPGLMPNDGDIVDMLADFVPDETLRRRLLVDNPKRLFEG